MGGCGKSVGLACNARVTKEMNRKTNQSTRRKCERINCSSVLCSQINYIVVP